MKTKTFLILRVVQVPTGVQQVALQNWIALHKTLDFSFLAARFFFPLFLGSLSRRVDSGYQEPRRVSRSLQPRGRWARSGKNASGCQLSAGDGGVACGVDERERFPCEVLEEQQRVSGGRWHSYGSQQLAGVGSGAPLHGAFPAVPIDLAGQDHVAGCAGRQGVEQPAPGRRRGCRPLTGALGQARKLQRCAIENLNSLSSSFVPHSRLFSLHPSLVSQNSSLLHGSGAMNSCGFMHGVGMHDNSLVVHENSWGAQGHKNSCSSHAARVRGGTKAPSMSTRVRVRRSAVEKLASPQQTSSKLHEETWEGLLCYQGIFREVEIVPGCVVKVACPSCPDYSPEPPGPDRVIRNMIGWSLQEKTDRSGVWLFRGALQGENLFSLHDAAGDWERKGSYRTAWAVPCDSSCTCSYAYGHGPAIGPHTGKRCWPLRAGVWRAIAPVC